jgi:F-type H+-transporting ATPase subunit b
MNINLSLLAQALTFALFIWFTVRFVWPPLMRAIEERQKTIADGLAAAERGRLDLEQATQRSAQVLREAKQQAQEILAQADRRAAEIVEEAKTAAKTEGERLIAGAKADIEREIARAREALRAQVAALVVAGAEQILRREVDEKAHADLLAAIQREL